MRREVTHPKRADSGGLCEVHLEQPNRETERTVGARHRGRGEAGSECLMDGRPPRAPERRGLRSQGSHQVSPETPPLPCTPTSPKQTLLWVPARLGDVLRCGQVPAFHQSPPARETWAWAIRKPGSRLRSETWGPSQWASASDLPLSPHGVGRCTRAGRPAESPSGPLSTCTRSIRNTGRARGGGLGAAPEGTGRRLCPPQPGAGPTRKTRLREPQRRATTRVVTCRSPSRPLRTEGRSEDVQEEGRTDAPALRKCQGISGLCQTGRF